MKVCCLRGALLSAALAVLVFIAPAYSIDRNSTPIVRSPLSTMPCFIYLTGIGCPHCANVDPVLMKEKVRQKNILVVEYEIYQDSENAPLLMVYDKQFESGLGVPLLIAGPKKEDAVMGDTPILKKLDQMIEAYEGNGLLLPTGPMSFATLILSDLPHLPKIWFKDRVAIRKNAASKESETIKKFLMTGVVPENCASVQNKEVALSDDKVTFGKACAFNGWVLMSN
jgi:hypothetical protein